MFISERISGNPGLRLAVVGPAAAALKEHTGPFSLTGGHPPLGGNGFPTLALPHGGSSRCFLSGAAVRRPPWPQLECRRGSALGGRPAPAGAGARCSGRGSALGGRPAAASSGPAKLAGRRPVPATRLPSRGKAAGKGRARRADKEGLQGCEKWERGSRPALLPESR